MADDERTRPVPGDRVSLRCVVLVWFRIREHLDWTPPCWRTSRVIHATSTSAATMIIEVIDPSTGSVIASKRFRNTLWGRPPSAVVVSASSSDLADHALFDVWQPRLRERSGVAR